MRILWWLDWFVRRLSHVAFLAAAVLLLVVGLLGFLDVVSLNLFSLPVPGLLEMSGTMLAVIVFLGLAEAQAQNQNIAIDLFTSRMPPVGLKLSMLLGLALGAFITGMIAWSAIHLASTAWRFHETALGALAFPTAPGKTLACIGAWIACAEYTRQFIRALFGPTVAGEA